MIITKTKRFVKKFGKLDVKIQQKLEKRVRIFQKNPLDPSLNNHALKGDFSGLRSINVTGDFRALFREYPEGTYEFVDFVDLGTHSQLYG